MSYPNIIIINGVSLPHTVLKPTSSAATILGSSRGAARRSQFECSPRVVGGLRRPKKAPYSHNTFTELYVICLDSDNKYVMYE
jgi:hypothetical protein